MKLNKLVAHRGDNTHYPENTHASIKAALDAGAFFVELDIQMNASQSLIVFHDDDYMRMAGIEKSVFETNDAEMQNISIHQPDKFGDKHDPTRVSLLTEVLNLLKEYPQAKMFIEVKQQSIDHWGIEIVMQKLLECLKDFQQQAIVISFNRTVLTVIHDESTLKTGLVFNQYKQKHLDAAFKIKPDYMICPYKIIPEEKVWQGNWKWMVYSANDMELAKKLLKRGDIDLIETDDICGMSG